MAGSSGVMKMVVWSAGLALAGSLAVLFIGMLVFGFQLAAWAEWEGRTVGAIGTIVGVAGAAVGLVLASRAARRAST